MALDALPVSDLGLYTTVLPIFVASSIVWWFLRDYLRLRHIPGPFLTSFTNLPRLYWVWSNRAHEKHIELHKRYGKIVRLGPNMVSVADAKEIPQIYDFSGKFTKSDFYRVLAFYVKGKPVQTIFATQDDQIHRALRRPIAGLYSMSNLVSFEPYVDTTMRYFFKQLDERFVDLDKACDLGAWLQYFAWDVIGEITFSKPLGFLARGDDVGGITRSIINYFSKASPVTQMPWVDYIWTKNPLLQRFRSQKVNPIVAFAIARAKEREGKTDYTGSDSELNSRDFLSRFLEAIEKDPSIPQWALTAWTTSNVTAGSDTTAILLRTVFYSLMKHPESLERLLAELNEAAKQNRLSDLVRWKETKDLVYLDAVIKEAGRMHPPFGLPLERVVPPEGAFISGKSLKAGTVVGISAWAVHRDKDTFGEDCDSWRPERWLCDETSRKKMEHALFTFGAGRRVCLGKHISYLEIYKLVPTLLLRYQFIFADPTCNEWEVKNRWFVHQTGLNVKLKKRRLD